MPKLSQVLLVLVFGLLAVTAVLKLWAVLGGQVEYRADPVLQVSMATAMSLASVWELGVSALLLCPARRRLKAVAVTVTGFLFLIYHLGARLNHFYEHCPCIGRAWKALGLHDQSLTLALASFIFLAGLVLLHQARRTV